MEDLSVALDLVKLVGEKIAVSIFRESPPLVCSEHSSLFHYVFYWN